MLVLSRKSNQNIVIAGDIVIKVVRVDRDVVKLGIEAPASITVHRQEVFEEIERCNRDAARSVHRKAPRIPKPVVQATEPDRLAP